MHHLSCGKICPVLPEKSPNKLACKCSTPPLLCCNSAGHQVWRIWYIYFFSSFSIVAPSTIPIGTSRTWCYAGRQNFGRVPMKCVLNVVTTQPNLQHNFNSTQSSFNPGWGYTVTGLHTHHHHHHHHHPPLTFKLDPDNIGECNFKTMQLQLRTNLGPT